MLPGSLRGSQAGRGLGSGAQELLPRALVIKALHLPRQGQRGDASPLGQGRGERTALMSTKRHLAIACHWRRHPQQMGSLALPAPDPGVLPTWGL